jgi:hypothetical protein
MFLRMTLLGRLACFFPVFHLLLILVALQNCVRHPDLVNVTVLTLCTYLVPPVLFRLYTLRHPVTQGRWVLNHPARCDWWIAHQLQMLYAALPFLEAFLRLIPGIYSAWLRLWGSHVGKRVYWTVLVEILDRHMLHIEDDVMFGHRVCCTAHIITKKTNGDLILVLRRPCIGKETLIGARARIGPGVRIPEKSTVPYGAEYRFSYA